MVKTLLATGALLAAVVAGGAYLIDRHGCPLSMCCSSAAPSDEGTDPSPSDSPSDTTPVAACGETCCSPQSRTALLTSAANPAAKGTAPTVVTVEGMDCPSCAKKLITQVNALTTVAKTDADFEKGTLTISAKAGTTVSPRLLWDTVEKAKYTPKRIVTPTATFSARPAE